MCGMRTVAVLTRTISAFPQKGRLEVEALELKLRLHEQSAGSWIPTTVIFSRSQKPSLVVLMQGSNEASFTYDSFIRVTPRRKRKTRAKGDTATPCDRLTRVREELETDGTWSLGCKEIFQKALDEACVKPRKVLCLGLGSPTSSRDARAQLAFLGYLCASLDIDSADVSVYDPVFTDADKQLFLALGMRCLDHGQVKHSLDCPTMLYMPHCDLDLYETIIRANWTLESLCTLVFLANRFRDYVDNNAASRLERESPCLLRLAPFVQCRPLPASDAFPGAFSSLSVQYVSRTPLSLQSNAFWEIRPLSDQDIR